MIDNPNLTDAELVRRVAALSPTLADLVAARLRALRLARVATPPPKPDNPLHILRQQRGTFPGK
jgi:hypothetical protein